MKKGIELYMDYRIEFDVGLWDYVLLIDGEKIPLNKQDVREANWYAKMIIEGRERRHDRSTGRNDTLNN